MHETQWWQVTFCLGEAPGKDPDELACDLVERGAAGCEMLSERKLRGYFRAGGAELEPLLAEVCVDGILCSAKTLIKDDNWTKRCSELWQPVTVGTLTIIPLLDAAASVERPTNALYLIPGLGFGTGHHATTRMVLMLLQHSALRSRPPLRALDVGTGSGILALACSLLYRTQVDAIDTDPDALRNAADNVALNAAQDRVNLKLGSLDGISDAYPLIMANLYFEILQEIQPRLRAALEDDGLLLLSGFTEGQACALRHTYAAWRLVEERQEEGWAAMLLAR